MKALVIYSSIHHGNTEKIAKEISNILQGDLVQFSDFRENILEDYDLIGFGSGIFHGRHHHTAIKIAQNINVKGKDTFIFSTSGSGQIKYNKVLADILASKGANLVGEFSCRGYNIYGLFKWIGGIGKGRPNEKDLLKAREFAHDLLKKVMSN
ncbi:flavodoxin family protein [Geosporobacter ferrireducens]|uniref:Flavodoxin n=1 Tax=Geosporobacter ferrireducens TaxID=1424294 RepID=A0A1D8GI63_9FIRM|nr:flavodoxin family protein [Geosporobacter ferrireducens]AOT70597.1 flavodoxin [Geosporobacter ferrireducens]MTI57390.1 flavodoxin [Geosporobacter ferrireducens]